MIDDSLQCPKQTRVSVCLVCVQSVSSLRLVWVHCQAANSCCALALCSLCVHSASTRSEVGVHSVSTERSRRVNPASTLRLRCVHWFFRKWVTLNAGCTLSADWVHACWNHSSALYCTCYSTTEESIIWTISTLAVSRHYYSPDDNTWSIIIRL